MILYNKTIIIIIIIIIIHINISVKNGVTYCIIKTKSKCSKNQTYNLNL